MVELYFQYKSAIPYIYDLFFAIGLGIFTVPILSFVKLLK